MNFTDSEIFSAETDLPSHKDCKVATEGGCRITKYQMITHTVRSTEHAEVLLCFDGPILRKYITYMYSTEYLCINP